MTENIFSLVKTQLALHLQAYRFTFNNEKQLQDSLETALRDGGFAFDREFQLSVTERPDFYLTDHKIALEVKVAGSLENHLRQMKRYAAHESVEGVILITTRRHDVPETLGGKPTGAISLWHNAF